MNQLNTNVAKLVYRAEIDGLRAIAVIAVVLYHAQLVFFGHDWFEGGYIGVDVFFVISGYLITRIILSELYQKSAFNFLSFYERRARRILPMLFLVIFVSIPFAWVNLLPRDFVEYAGSILASIFFSSNFFFYFNTTTYGADSSLLMPLLHTWSLGVEEQFYIVFPILALLSYKLFRRYFLVVLIVLSLISLWFAEIMQLRNPDLNFYLPVTRFWEIAVGSILAIREMSQKGENVDILRRSLPKLGFCMIGYAIFFFGGDTPHPSFHTLIPIIGVALVIGFSSREEIVGKVLGSKPLVWVGLISYSLYLWHFPIFAFSRLGLLFSSNYDRMGWILLALILSIVSYYWIELPFRNSSKVSKRAFLFALSVSTIALVTGASFIIGSKGFPARLPPILLKSAGELAVPTWDRLSQAGVGCHGRMEKFCYFEKGDDATNVYIFGDSHLSAIAKELAEALSEDFNYLEANLDQCPFVLGITGVIYNGSSLPTQCNDTFEQKRLSEISVEPSVIIVGGRFPLYLEGTYFDNFEGGVEGGGAGKLSTIDNVPLKELVRKTYQSLLDGGHHLVILYPIPSVGWNLPQEFLRRFKNADAQISIDELRVNPITTSYEVYRQRTKSSFDLFDSVTHQNIHRVYPHQLFCDLEIKARCVTHDTEFLYYYDDDHPSVKGAEMITSLLVDAVAIAGVELRSQ